MEWNDPDANIIGDIMAVLKVKDFTELRMGEAIRDVFMDYWADQNWGFSINYGATRIRLPKDMEEAYSLGVFTGPMIRIMRDDAVPYGRVIFANNAFPVWGLEGLLFDPKKATTILAETFEGTNKSISELGETLKKVATKEEVNEALKQAGWVKSEEE